FLIVALFAFQSFSQNKTETKDSIWKKNLNEVVITALRSVTPMKEIPAAISIVQDRQFNSLNKSIAADEVLRMIPGVKVDNGTDGSRVHLYIRGQGVLSESGFRGIAVFIDGISVNDPGGYCPDLYDVDWQTVKSVEVVKGLSTSMYGGSATGGVVNITTKDGGLKPITETFYATAGSYGFWKALDQIDGTVGNVNYRVSYSHSQGNGYRDHQAFMSDNFSEKLNWTPTDKIKITQTATYTNYFNQNSEGMNLARIRGEITFGPQQNNMGWRASNNDAVPYNEFHKTQRLTTSLTGKFDVAKNQDITVKGFFRMNNYRETSNNGDDYKPYINPGVSAQYNWTCGKNNLVNHFSVGADYATQTITEHEYAVPGEFERDSNRIDSHFGQTCFDLNTILINQIIRQRSFGAFILEKVDIFKKLYFVGSLRYDYVYNRLSNNIPMPDSLSLSGSRTFQKPTYSVGLAYDVMKEFNVYANFGTGFLVPTNDELYNNPDYYGGLNTTIKPATSQGEELGFRGDVGNFLHYDVTGFYMVTKNGFYRYSLPGRGNNTAFFGNKEEHKYGVETFVSYSPVKFLTIDAAYTYSHFQYPAHDSVDAHFIPNCPQHMLTAEIAYRINKNFTLTLGTEFQSSWKLQVDDSIYNNYHIGATYYQPYSEESSTVTAYDKNNKPLKYGYNIYNASFTYRWKLGKVEGELSLYAKNIFNQHYFGFTEPNNGVDYNSYQPAPGREFFGSVKIRL
ncbi:MAG: TonB-dependent receptor, partial [Bacteroidota bacterium]